MIQENVVGIHENGARIHENGVRIQKNGMIQENGTRISGEWCKDTEERKVFLVAVLWVQ